MCGGLGGLCAAVEPGSRSPRPRPPGQEPLPACRGADNALAWGRVAPGQTPPPISATQEAGTQKRACPGMNPPPAAVI